MPKAEKILVKAERELGAEPLASWRERWIAASAAASQAAAKARAAEEEALRAAAAEREAAAEAKRQAQAAKREAAEHERAIEREREAKERGGEAGRGRGGVAAARGGARARPPHPIRSRACQVARGDRGHPAADLLVRQRQAHRSADSEVGRRGRGFAGRGGGRPLVRARPARRRGQDGGDELALGRFAGPDGASGRVEERAPVLAPLGHAASRRRPSRSPFRRRRLHRPRSLPSRRRRRQPPAEPSPAERATAAARARLAAGDRPGALAQLADALRSAP
jgi:hypothetical protein